MFYENKYDSFNKIGIQNFHINNNKIRLQIKILNEIQNIELFKNSNIRTIKYKILNMYGIMIDKQKLIFKNMELCDNKMINDYRINDMDIIFCTIFE
jgi:hypothetical protein